MVSNYCEARGFPSFLSLHFVAGCEKPFYYRLLNQELLQLLEAQRACCGKEQKEVNSTSYSIKSRARQGWWCPRRPDAYMPRREVGKGVCLSCKLRH